MNAAALDAERDAEVDGGPLRVRMAAVTAHLPHTATTTVILLCFVTYRPGSFHQQAKKVRKTLISTIF